ncbi:related to interferon-regulated resistance GTP-binding protein [Rhynchosporium graminicola]|uniref:Related to interferon-regulated resistance GTP-binding protein n=1 Tax=Rhynchosporium graminicola TaxID=2792576 RepID=A0A1E1LHY2_9HELO|nr:related to interferon-regulated resistance GTP-binding protein [Rhynchosporium commune]
MTKVPISVGAAVDAQDFAGEQQGLLDLIDKLQFAQLDNVKLPQIVVVGDQSAGKSSVLEAISGMPFPRESGACTRFATEIRLRRAKDQKFVIKIIPDRTRPMTEQKRLLDFGNHVDDSVPFDVLMSHAVEQIAPKRIPGRFATRDILVVEKSGPTEPLLTLVDLPGLVRNANNDQSEDDIRAINDLTDKYMKSSRTIILAVVGGNGDYVQAPVLNKARKFDPSGSRTIGVLTKPDLTESIGLEDKFIALVNNQDKHNDFKLGWYVLLNPGPRDVGQEWPSTEERKAKEDRFFNNGKWAALSPHMCGVAALKQKLSEQLQRHIGKHVRTLRDEISKALEECEAELKSMGTGKDTIEEMRGELIALCSDSSDLVKPAVDGTFKNPPGKSFFPRGVDARGTPAQKLRARVVDENRRFAARVRLIGHKHNFTPGVEEQQNPLTRVMKGTMTKAQFAKKEVEPLIQQNTGTEFPLDYNPRLVYSLFQEYSENWPRLAQQHKDNLGVICSEFLAEVIEDVWPQRMREPLRKEFLDSQMKEMLDKSRAEVVNLENDQHLEVQPYDLEYTERIKQWRAAAGPENPYTEAEEVLEKMLIHYELSSRIFITNVITQVIERHLLQGLYSIFNSVKIYNLKDTQIEAIAAENKATRDKRMALKAKRTAIEEAGDICAKLSMRKELRSYEEEDMDGTSSDDEDIPTPTSSEPSRTLRRPVKPVPETVQQQQPISPRAAPPVVDISTPITNYILEREPRGYASSSTPSHNTVSGDFSRTTPGGWNNSVNEQYSAPNEPPQYPPPPPRRPDKQRIEDPFYPVSPPDSTSRRAFAGEDVNGNGHRSSGSGFEAPVRAPSQNSIPMQQHQSSNFEDSERVGPGKKTARWLKGMKN